MRFFRQAVPITPTLLILKFNLVYLLWASLAFGSGLQETTQHTGDARYPESLVPWAEWVASQQKYKDCPYAASNTASSEQSKGDSKKICQWPSRLWLTHHDQGASFKYEVVTFSDRTKIPLPGDSKQWPTRILVNNKPADVIEENNKPYVILTQGNLYKFVFLAR
ncbi:hypothetical protein [Marinibactrum halimedae]|uniref:Uncharacterized protein n=1 Tax=Marinibactrum halimedae TaxID=1444977 RepID=A0AA37TAY0_9GAMM|nr:hypothetical protein [Marinibactrum halimedae]MCD9461377.1 hypothetical protein [Marinibactrum halimedae]GLS28067.1 hypothetical protein GCM10007877_37860 [Marinibactrum halimedae]